MFWAENDKKRKMFWAENDKNCKMFAPKLLSELCAYKKF